MNRNRLTDQICAGACLLALLVAPFNTVANPAIVENGEPRASIVIAEDPPRLVGLAARELQTYVDAITGAVLPIGTASDPDRPVTIYVGRSAFTDAQGITDEGLYHGAYRMVSGPDWLVLLGRDRDFTPIEPWPRNHHQFPARQAAWEEIYDGPCDNPMNFYAGPSSSFNRDVDIWKQDEGGSLQAVYALLRDWGVRWFMPGELGEVVPESPTLALPAADRTVHPDFPIRNLFWSNRFRGASRDDVLWWLRLGLNNGSSVLGVSMHVHGMRVIHGNAYMQEHHPDFFALHRGERVTDYRGDGHACFSSPGLFDATVKYLRAVFDHFDEPAMDLWPQDAYHHCECDLCAGQSPSDIVFGFLDRVARDLYQTHPDRLITSGAYAEYARPPDAVDSFSPNVAIFIAARGRPLFDVPARWQSYQDQLSIWREKLAPGNIIRHENNLYNQRLVIHPRAFAKDLRALKGISLGDWCEVPRGYGPSPATQWANPGINHLNYYVQSQLLWEAELDLDALLDDYHDRFYGPAADAMQAAFDYAEQHYNRHRRVMKLPERTVFVERLHAAREQAGETRYGERIQVILDELEPLDALRAELQAQRDAGNPRETAPVAVARRLDADAEPPRHTFRPLVAYRHRESAVPLPTTFSISWTDDVLVFDVHCAEPDMDTLEIGSNVWEGDSVLILLETPRHSHYLIQIAPDGRVFDADRNDAGRLAPAWSSLVEVETERGTDFWRVRARIPLAVVGDDETYGDPLHRVVAPQPGPDGDWFFNIGRTRVRDGRRMRDEEGYAPFAFSPTARPMHLLEEFPPRHFARLTFEPVN